MFYDSFICEVQSDDYEWKFLEWREAMEEMYGKENG